MEGDNRLCRYFAKNYLASMPIIHSLTRQLIPFAPTALRAASEWKGPTRKGCIQKGKGLVDSVTTHPPLNAPRPFEESDDIALLAALPGRFP